MLQPFCTACAAQVGKWGPIALLFILGPICGYFGARQLDHRKVTIYLGFCFLKSTSGGVERGRSVLASVVGSSSQRLQV